MHYTNADYLVKIVFSDFYYLQYSDIDNSVKIVSQIPIINIIIQ